ncbi:hypothetical protein [Botrimarina sp.]|uniref:hypothetical protein n=1 Tax=Botrimarina sp. TaxID=2795802 RepID=UPI0032F07F2B
MLTLADAPVAGELLEVLDASNTREIGWIDALATADSATMQQARPRVRAGVTIA